MTEKLLDTATNEILNDIKKEVKATVGQIAAIRLDDHTNVDGSGAIRGPVSILIAKSQALDCLLNTAKGLVAIDNIDRKYSAMVKASINMRSALIELTDPKDPKAKDFVASLVRDFDDALSGVKTQ